MKFGAQLSFEFFILYLTPCANFYQLNGLKRKRFSKESCVKLKQKFPYEKHFLYHLLRKVFSPVFYNRLSPSSSRLICYTIAEVQMMVDFQVTFRHPSIVQQMSQSHLAKVFHPHGFHLSFTRCRHHLNRCSVEMTSDYLFLLFSWLVQL